MWIKRERETLSRYAGGVDYGTERDVVLRKGDVFVSKTRGHTAWSGVGSQAYYSPSWRCHRENEPYRSVCRLAGYIKEGEGRITNERWLSWLPKIALKMGLRVEDLPQRLPRGGTLVWEEASR